MTNVYEGLFILDSNRYSRDASGISGQVTEIVQKHGGEVLVSRLWEERRLAYPINGQRKGTYWLVYFKLDSRKVPGIERDCQINDNIVRALILKVDPRIADAVVSHAVADPATVARAQEEKPAEGATPAAAAAETAEAPAQ